MIAPFVLHLGDCLDVLRTMEAESVHAIVTDPPYGLAFMGKRWDYDVPSVEIWAECLRVLKPGGHLLAFAGTRTQHRMACRIEDAGFEIRDMIAWVYGSGFPKSMDVSKAIDRVAGAEREVVGSKLGQPGYRSGPTGENDVYGAGLANGDAKCEVTAPATPEAQQWAGWGTALKPALEPITMARKPLAGTVAANVLEHGTGALNVDGCRVAAEDGYTENAVTQGVNTAQTSYAPAVVRRTFEPCQSGRWPANLVHDGSEDVMELFPETSSGALNQASVKATNRIYNNFPNTYANPKQFEPSTGSAARFFYTAKASAAERQGVTHPTVKPLDLMAYLCRLVTPPGGIVLDPFAGSGTTLKAAISEGFQAIGIERDPAYHAMAERRLNGAQLGLSLGGLP
jgi:DNA modification methylase